MPSPRALHRSVRAHPAGASQCLAGLAKIVGGACLRVCVGPKLCVNRDNCARRRYGARPEHLVRDQLIRRKELTKAFSEIVTNANCPRNNLNVYISNDRPQACAEDPTCLRLSHCENKWARQKAHSGSARTTARVEVARYLSQAEFPSCNKYVTTCAAEGGLDGQVRWFAASASVNRGALALRWAHNCSGTRSIDCSARTQRFARKRVVRHVCRRPCRLLNATTGEFSNEGDASAQRWSCVLRQAVKVDSAMKRVIHHEDAETVFG